MMHHFGRMLGAALGLLAVVATASAPAWAEPPSKHVLILVQGPDGHEFGSHEFVAGGRIIAALLEATPGLKIETLQADGAWPEGPPRIRQADAVVLFLSEGARWVAADPRRADALAELAARGGGLVGLHWAIGTRDPAPIEAFLKLLGGCHGGPDRKFKVLETEVAPAQPRHPIAHGIEPFRIRDEFYYRLKFVQPADQIQSVLTANVDEQPETVAWAWERPDGGRSFGFSGLHFHDNWKHPAYRRLVPQAVLWSLKVPIPKDGVPVDLPESVYHLPPRSK